MVILDLYSVSQRSFVK